MRAAVQIGVCAAYLLAAVCLLVLLFCSLYLRSELACFCPYSPSKQ